jgi:hypothetical protein
VSSRDLPLDSQRYTEFLYGLRRLVADDPQLKDIGALRRFVDVHQSHFGPRTAVAMRFATDDAARALIHVAVLAATELTDLHEASRNWLGEHGYALPPWDVSVPRNAQRLISFAERIYGVVEWEPARRVQFDPSLEAPALKWATALAVGIGERPQWTNDEVWRYAAYLVMGTEEFGSQRPRSDEDLASHYQVPLEAVRYRRQLPDVV